jgi:hypothetical protein
MLTKPKNNREFLQTRVSGNISGIFDGYRSGALLVTKMWAANQNSFLVSNQKVANKRVTFMLTAQNFWYEFR